MIPIVKSIHDHDEVDGMLDYFEVVNQIFTIVISCHIIDRKIKD